MPALKSLKLNQNLFRLIETSMSSNSKRELFLVQTNGGMKIPIINGGQIILGRSRLTKIKDKRLSKHHLKLVSAETKNTLSIQHIGKNSSTVKGSVIRHGFVGTIAPGDKLELLEGKHEFQLVMNEDVEKSVTAKPSNHWSNGLFQSMNDPNMIWYKNDEICIIKDKYPKAMQHFLVLPRKENISTLKKLTNQHLSLVQTMIDSAKNHVIKSFLEKEPKLKFRCGFHAIPSMALVHMHVISQDFISPCLKTKRHWNSFNTPYFIEADNVIEYLSKEGFIPNSVDQEAKKWLAEDVKCNQCSHKPRGMGMSFKKHLEDHYNC